MSHEATMRRLYGLVNARDVEGFDDVMADDFVEHEETPGLAPTRDGVKESFRGMPATGKRVDVQLMDIDRFGDDGLAHEHWGVLDALTMLQQLGAVPEGPGWSG